MLVSKILRTFVPMTIVRRIFLSLFLFVMSLACSNAQVALNVISQHYTTADGLPSNNVMCALKDRQGFLWFGTWYGLCRFDGAEFVTYHHPKRPNSDIPPRRIESMTEDHQGVLWLKTVDWKLYTFDPRTERFHAVYDELKKHTKNLQVIKIQRTSEGKVLLLTKDKTLLLASTDKEGLPQLTKLYDARGKIDAQSFQLKEDVVGKTRDYSFYIGRDFRLFIMRNQPKADLTKAMAQAQADSLKQEAHHLLLLNEAGINKYSSLYQDSDSLLWVTTTNQGVYCLTTPPRLFRLITLPDNDQTGVRCLYQMHNGNILVSTRSRNVYIYDANGNLQKTLPYSQYGIGAVYYAMEDNQGRLWLSTKGDGLVLGIPDASKPSGYQLTHYRHDPANPNSISGNNVYMTLVDSQQHLWVCTLDGGLNLVNEQGEITFYHWRNGFANYPSYGLYAGARNIVEDKNGRIWVGTVDGLMSFNSHFQSPKDIRFQTYRETPEASFANNDIYALYHDQREQIWVGAFGGGLQHIAELEASEASTGADIRFVPLGVREGLRSDFILSIVEDARGHLWFATEAGLSCYNQETGRIRNIDHYDGLPPVEMEEAVAMCCSNGQLWVGSKQGILTFNPAQLQMRKADYSTRIIELVYDNQPYIGATALNFAENIELKHDQNAFTIEFSALNYQYHSQLNYRYRLEGFDRDWRYSGPHRVASYNEVPPGNYTFLVETIDDANPTLHSSAKIHIRILPPWWQTWWAYLIYICLFLLIAFLVIRTILQMNRMRNEIYISQRLAKLTSKPDEGDEFIDRLHRTIRENIANSDFNIDDLASEMGLSRSAFYKKVKSQTGFAPVDLIKEFRLSYAAELLQTTNHSITEVAWRSGFKDASYFGKCFRKRYGMSPREYLQQPATE